MYSSIEALGTIFFAEGFSGRVNIDPCPGDFDVDEDFLERIDA